MENLMQFINKRIAEQRSIMNDPDSDREAQERALGAINELSLAIVFIKKGMQA